MYAIVTYTRRDDGARIGQLARYHRLDGETFVRVRTWKNPVSAEDWIEGYNRRRLRFELAPVEWLLVDLYEFGPALNLFVEEGQ